MSIPTTLLALSGLGLWIAAETVPPELRRATEPPVSNVLPVTANLAFDRWVSGFRSRARAGGLRAATLDAALRGIRYNSDVIAKDRNQTEFSLAIWEYLDRAVSPSRVRNGRAALRENRRVLAEIEARYGVEAEVVAAIWGVESAYGHVRGDIPVIESLATLAFDGRRGRFFEQQLIAALQILQAGDVRPADMKGSWAGAMGHTQFIPTSYLAYAQDFRGDGRRDIWSDDPTDALASTAAYLAKHGWRKGQPWGVEVRLPRGFDYSQSGRKVAKPVRDWMALGIRDVDGGRIPEYGRASILLPAGARGAAFMVFGNFRAIERYNASEAYVIAVGHLSDRLAGGRPIRADWPEGDRPLLLAERKELQSALSRAGFNTGGVDGIIGPNTFAAIRAFQRSNGMIPDGYPSYELLRRLRRVAR